MLWWTLLQIKSRKSETRLRAVQELGLSKKPRAVRALIAALKDQEALVRYKAIDSLANIGVAAIDPLFTTLNEPDPNVRKASVQALAKIRDKRAIEPLIAALKDSYHIIREEAVEALEKIDDPRVVEPLIAALSDSEERVRRQAAQALSERADIRALDPLIKVLDDQTDFSRGVRLYREAIAKAVARALGKIGDARAVEPLVRLLKSGVSKQEAAEALGKIADAQAAEALVTALNDKDSNVRMTITHALVKIGAGAVEPLLAALKQDNVTLTKAAANALAKIGDRRAIEPLIPFLRDCRLRETALECLYTFGWKHDNSPAWRTIEIRHKNNAQVLITLNVGSMERADLHDLNLQEADLQGTNLKYANFKGANLRWANLEGANLEGANLELVNAGGANLRGSNLSNANLRNSNLQDATLGGAIVKGADFEYASCNGRTEWPSNFVPIAAGVVYLDIAPFTGQTGWRWKDWTK